jgi:hypothetical protein
MNTHRSLLTRNGMAVPHHILGIPDKGSETEGIRSFLRVVRHPVKTLGDYREASSEAWLATGWEIHVEHTTLAHRPPSNSAQVCTRLRPGAD